LETIMKKPFTAAQLKKLLANSAANAEQGGGIDHTPVVKFFCPWGAATWLITEFDGEDQLFGLCDMGHGYPELGYVSLSELRAIKGPWGLTIERDLHFKGSKPLSAYVEQAREEGRISA
jgi:hypothetical protein